MTAPATGITGDRATRARGRPRWERYAVWQARDFAFGPGAPMLVLSLLYACVTLRWDARGLGDWAVDLLGRYGSVFAISGIVSQDRVHGRYRFALAKPVAPWHLYAQAFVIRLLGLAALIGLMAGMFAVAGYPVRVATAIAAIVSCLLLGSFTLLLSTQLRSEWIAVLITMAVQDAALTVFRSTLGPWHAVGVTLVAILPPFTTELLSTQSYVVWKLGYAIAAFAAALWILHRREWAR
jgi:hypothetical protein